jgi:hypothetical protein
LRGHASASARYRYSRITESSARFPPEANGGVQDARSRLTVNG